MKIVSIVVFLIVQILFLPFAIVGFLVVAYKQLVVSKRKGASATAISAIAGRWMMHIYGLRRDLYTYRLYHVLPTGSAWGLWLLLFPSYLKYKIHPVVTETGKESLTEIPRARTLLFDRLVKKSVGSVLQFVVMGAGYDTRSYGLCGSGIKCFELDRAETQKVKRDSLRKAGIDSSKVEFVPIDFRTEKWYAKLIDAGFDPHEKTLFLWEGVSLYLSEGEVVKTIGEMKEHSIPGSVLLADFYSERLIRLQGVKTTAERFNFGLDFSSDDEKTLKSFLEKVQLKADEYYFMGYKNKKGAWGVVAEIDF